MTLALTLHLAPRDGGRAQVLVRAWAPGGRRYSQASVPIALRRAPLRPLPRLLDVRAARKGGSIVVIWRTSRPATGAIFLVMGRPRRHGRPLAVDYSDRGPKTSFRMRLRPLPGERIGRIRWVSVLVVREHPPNDSRRVTVPVTG